MNTEKYLASIELDKIVSMLQKRLFCDQNSRITALDLICADYQQTDHELQRTQAMFLLCTRFSPPSVNRVADVKKSVIRAAKGGVLSMGELLAVGRMMGACKALIDWYNSTDGDDMLQFEFDQLTYIPEVYRRIKDSILSEEEMADTASDTLFSIRRSIVRAQGAAREKLESMMRSQNNQKFLQDQLITMRDGRFVLPVKAEHKGDLPGLVHDASQSGATLFVEPMAVVELNNRVRILKSEEQQEIERIIWELTEMVVSAKDEIVEAYDRLLQLDILQAKAKLAVAWHATMPLLNNEGKIVLKSARHPLIAPDRVVPIDISLGDGFHTLIITGPNTGGKTVALKTLGLFAYMTRCGMMLPAANGSEMSYFENVYVDIGDEQSIEQNLSTFSSHLVNIDQIVRHASSQDMVLLDELGAGTDPSEGAAFGIAVLEYLAQNGCKIAASTHYSELKVYAMNTKGVQNASCEFDVESLRPTYRFLMGVPGKSNAFAIATRLGLPGAIIRRAKELTSSDQLAFEDVLEELQNQRSELERKLERETEQAHKALLRQQAAQQKAEAELLLARKTAKQAETEAQAVIARVRREAEGIIAEIKAKSKAKDSSLTPGAIRNQVDKLYDVAKVSVEDSENYTLPRPLKVGDNVTIAGLSTVYSVAAIQGKQVTLQNGSITTRVKIDQVRLAKKAHKKQVTGYHLTSDRAQRQAKTEIDLRGFAVDEACLELDAFIDNAMMNHLSEIWIIHGKGTGVLRAGIHAYLKRHKGIKSFRLGVYGEGENGVTIATLRD